MVSGIFRDAVLKTTTPDEMRGRLEGVSLTVVAAGPSLGDLEAGALASVTSVPFSIVCGGLACIVGVGVLAVAIPQLARYDAEAALREAASGSSARGSPRPWRTRTRTPTRRDRSVAGARGPTYSAAARYAQRSEGRRAPGSARERRSAVDDRGRQKVSQVIAVAVGILLILFLRGVFTATTTTAARLRAFRPTRTTACSCS